jgi:group I intron endonuclease
MLNTYMREYPESAGIYKLVCNNNGKIYIGKSTNIYKRINRHKNCSKHVDNRYLLQNAIIKHGWDSFSVEILEIFENFKSSEDNDYLLDRESHYIRHFESNNLDKGYNICEYSTDTGGKPLSEDHKEKIRKSLLGRKFSEETKQKMRQAQLGKKLSEEQKEKLRRANLGKKVSDETKEKLRIANTGRVKSPETIEKLKNRIYTEEHKEKLRQANLGKKHSDETREKIRKASLGRKHSEEHKEKLRGRTLTEEHKRKIGESSAGKKMSEESKIKMKIAAKKRGISDEQKIKMLQVRKNNKLKRLEEMDKSAMHN